jgi:hypothetical protein
MIKWIKAYLSNQPQPMRIPPYDRTYATTMANNKLEEISKYRPLPRAEGQYIRFDSYKTGNK